MISYQCIISPTHELIIQLLNFAGNNNIFFHNLAENIKFNEL